MAALPNFVSVEEFRLIPEGEYQYELHCGEVVAMTRPRVEHWVLQERLRGLLAEKLTVFGVVAVEMPYRPVPEFEYRAADVGVLSRGRFEKLHPKSDLYGAPELVVEVKSPSNSAKQLRDLVGICLAHGSLEVWIVDIDAKCVTVMRQDGIAHAFGPGDSLSLSAFGSDSLAVDDIFA